MDALTEEEPTVLIMKDGCAGVCVQPEIYHMKHEFEAAEPSAASCLQMAGLRRRPIHSTRFRFQPLSWTNNRANKSVEDRPESCLLPDLPLIIPFFPSRAECSLKHSSSVDDIKSDQRYWQKRLQLRHSCTGEDTPTFTSCCSCTSPRTTPAQSSH